MSAYFITASGTDIGKTFATRALIAATQARKQAVHAVKPIISGFDPNDNTTDTALIAKALGVELQSISPWRFAAPLSPNMAAAHEGKKIDFNALVNWSSAQIKPNALTLIEGVGGVMVPLNETYTVRDWMAALKIPVILVTGSYLGSINHTLTAVEALRIAKIPIAALIVSESENSAVSPEETLDTLNAFICDIPLRIAQPRVSSPAQATAIHALLEKLA